MLNILKDSIIMTSMFTELILIITSHAGNLPLSQRENSTRNTRINLPTSSISHFWVLKIFWICFCFPYKALQSSCGVTYIYIPYLLSLKGTSRSNKVCLTQPSNVYCVSFSLFTNFLFCILLYSKFLLSGLTIMYSCLLRSMASLQKCSWI